MVKRFSCSKSGIHRVLRPGLVISEAPFIDRFLETRKTDASDDRFGMQIMRAKAESPP